MTDEWIDDPNAQAWAKRVLDDLVPKLQGSALSMVIVPGEADVKLAVELGFSLLLGKPLVLVVPPGAHVPPKLVAVADAIVELGGEDFDRRVMEAIGRVLGELP